MTVILQLPPELTAALRAEVDRTGQSQQMILQQALVRYLRLDDAPPPGSDREAARASRLVRPARVGYRRVTPRLAADGLELVDRVDRL
jgi:hypothetical protein